VRLFGFTNDGAPAALNIVRSVRQAKSRRIGLRAGRVKRLHALEERERILLEEIAARQQQGLDTTAEEAALAILRDEIVIARKRVKTVPFIDPVDLRYNNWTSMPIPAIQAVMFCVMDVSGSMDEDKKQLAKTFFLLLYLFLQRNYERIDIRFIRYHSHATEVDEHDFYYGIETGGTVTSTALELTHKIISDEYPSSLWNIYIAHASDGDNFSYDNPAVEDVIEDKLLPRSQYYAYVQVDPDGEFDAANVDADPDNLLNVMSNIRTRHSNVGVGLVAHDEDIYPVFLKLFERKAPR
jgi:uncharacterized sporulation protein YeaH/YhbH (DUF444 family)